jgi:hypothetical protein
VSQSSRVIHEIFAKHVKDYKPGRASDAGTKAKDDSKWFKSESKLAEDEVRRLDDM